VFPLRCLLFTPDLQGQSRGKWRILQGWAQVISYLFYVLGWVLICFVPKTPAMVRALIKYPCKIRHLLLDRHCNSEEDVGMYLRQVDEDTVSLMLVGSRCALGVSRVHPCQIRHLPLDCHCNSGVNSQV
jgi:hypothetical protein